MAIGYGLAAAALIGAGGSIAGGLIGSGTGGSGDLQTAGFDPANDFALQASQLESLGRSGWFNPQVLKNAGPMGKLVNQINASVHDEKIKRRALQELQLLIQNNQIREDGSFDVVTDSQWGRYGIFNDIEGNARFPGELKGALARIGMSPTDLANLISQESEYQTKIQSLMDLGPFQEDVIRDRLSAAAQVSDVAGGILSGRGSDVQNRVRDQFIRDRTRGIDQAEESLTLRGKHGGFNPSVGLERIAELRSDLNTDAELASIERSLLYAGGVNDLLAPGTAAAQGQAGLSSSTSLGALNIAANQATAANSLNGQLQLAGRTSLANGVSGAATGIGDAITAYSLLGGNTAPGYEYSNINDAINPTNAEFNRIVNGYQ